MARRAFGTVEARYRPRDTADWKEGRRKSKPLPTSYRARYRDPRTKAPQRGPWINAPHTFTTKAEADAWLAAVKTDIDRGTWKHPDQIAAEEEAACLADIEARRPFGPYAEAWLELRNLSKATRDAYRSNLNTHLIPKWGTTPIRQITTADVRAWVAKELAPGRPGARKHAYDLFRTIMATAVDESVIDTNPCKRNMLGSTKADHGVSSRHAPRALTPTEVATLAEEVPRYMRAMILLMAVTGMRSGEIRELRVKDLDLTAGVISVNRAVTGDGGSLTEGTPKTEASIRDVHIDVNMVNVLKAHLAEREVRGRDALVFPSSRDPRKHLPQRTFQINLARAAERAGIPHLSPHDLRNTAASLAGRQQGVSVRDVQQMLGQETPFMAARYMRSDDATQAAIAKAVTADVFAATREDNITALADRRKQA